MPNILSSNLREKNINNFLETLSNESVYFTFSKPSPWANENSPDVPMDSSNLTASVFSNMLYAKKVVSSNVSKVVKNYGWVSGSRFQQFDPSVDIGVLTNIITFVLATATSNLTGGSVSSVDMVLNGNGYTTVPNVSPDSGSATFLASISDGGVVSIAVVDGGEDYVTAPNLLIDPPSTIYSGVFDLRPYYIITDEMKVYMCLNNNGGIPSTVKPTSIVTTSAMPTALADGYVWKYLFTVSATNLERFYTSNWIPLATLLSDDGSLQWDVQEAAGKTTLNANIGATGINSISTIGVVDNSFMQPNDILLVGSEQMVVSGATGFIGATGIVVQRGMNSTTISASTFGIVVNDLTTAPGSDPENELNAANVMLKVRVAENEGGQIIDTNAYRQISLLLNPISKNSFYYAGATGTPVNNQISLNSAHDYSDPTKVWYPSTGKNVVILGGTGRGQIRTISSFSSGVITVSESWDTIPASDSLYGIVANATVLNQTLVLQLNTMTGGSEFTQDSVVTQDVSEASGTVVEHDTTLGLLYLTNLSGTFNGTNSVSSGTISSTIQNIYKVPDLVPNLGEILYIENRKAITRYSDQIEDVKVIITY